MQVKRERSSNSSISTGTEKLQEALEAIATKCPGEFPAALATKETAKNQDNDDNDEDEDDMMD